MNALQQNAEGAGGRTEPTNRQDRAAFAAMSADQREQVAAESARLYDGTRTVAECWREALRKVS